MLPAMIAEAFKSSLFNRCCETNLLDKQVIHAPTLTSDEVGLDFRLADD
jgi:hypothetical protein